MNSGDLVDGRYEILCEVASGGMATVYAARVVGAVGFEKLVALKRMLPSVSADERYRRMFLDEAKVAAHIHSPYVVSTFDLGAQSDGSLYIVMDLVVGTALSSILAGSRGRLLPVGAVATIIEQSARGMHDAHTATSNLGEPLRIIHRDISPQNLLVGVDGATRVTDFGVAHAVERLTKTVGFKVKGKLSYCSPEQAQAQPLDPRSDIFSLGIVMWETLLLRRLYEGETAMETVQAQAQPVTSPLTFRPEIPAELANIVMRALERDPAARFQSALEMAEAIRATGIGAPTAEIQALVREMAGASVNTLTSSIKEAIARSSVRSSSFLPPTTPIGRRTLGARTMMSLEAVDPKAVRAAPFEHARQHRAERLAMAGGPRETKVERPVSPQPSSPHSPEVRPIGPSLDAHPDRRRRLRLVALVSGILVLGGVLGGVGVFAALSAPVASPAAPTSPAPGLPANLPTGLPAPAPTPAMPTPTMPTPTTPTPAMPTSVTGAPPSGAGAVSDKPDRNVSVRQEPTSAAGGGRTVCDDTCTYANDNECDDGGDGSTNAVCTFGTDCTDCGVRRSVSCSNTCQFAGDGQCDDGGPNSEHAICLPGTDCDDCGRR